MNKKDHKYIAKLEKWFSDEHDRIMDAHGKADGIIAKCLEGYVGGHDHAWIQWQNLLEELGIPFKEVLKMRKD